MLFNIISYYEGIVPPTLKLTTPPHSSKKKGKSKAKPPKKGTFWYIFILQTLKNTKNLIYILAESEASTVDPDTVVDDTGNEDVQDFQIPNTIPEDLPAGFIKLIF